MRKYGLDIIRILLALYVCLFHASINVVTRCNFGIATYFFNMGAIAMTGFFILSGFCIEIAYINRNFNDSKNFLNFYSKRAIKIFPLYWIVGFIYKIFISSEKLILSFMIVPVELLGMQSIFSSLFSFSHISGTWFVSCIILCYIIFPFLHQLLEQLNNKMLCICIGGGYCFLLYAAIIQWLYKINSIYDNPFIRIIEFSIGIFLAKLYFIRKNRNLKNNNVKISTIWCIATFIFFIIVTVTYKKGIAQGNYMFYNFVGIPYWLISIWLLVEFKINNCFIRKSISFFSNITYAFFLANILTGKYIMIFVKKFHTGNITNILLNIGCDLVVALILHYIIEIPIVKLYNNKIKYKEK